MKEALTFYDENENWKKDAIYTLGDGNNELVITSDNREYVRGDKLYVEFNGVNIYASLDQIIYINTKTKVVMIKEKKELSPPDEREYLVLLSYYDESTENSYQGIVGRQETFDFIKANVENINITVSLVLSETVSFKDAITVYEFMNRCINNEMVQNDDGFDINEYYFEPN